MNIAIRLDSGPHIGSGHLIRCGALAKELVLRKQNVIFICRNKATASLEIPIVYLDRAYGSYQSVGYCFPTIDDEVEEMQTLIKKLQINCLIVDHYGATAEYYESLKKSVKYLVAVDDLAKVRLPIDMVVNGNAYANQFDYKDATVGLCGTEYTLLRDRFRNVPKKEISDEIRDIYITSGGADPFAFCEKILSFLTSADITRAQIHVIIGSDFSIEYQKRLTQFSAQISNVHMVYHADMRKCMEQADLFISAAGSTLYELAACGVPNISVILAEDQRLLAKSLHLSGCTCNIGELSALRQERFLEKFKRIACCDVRKEMSRIGQQMLDGFGSQRVALEISKRMEHLNE